MPSFSRIAGGRRDLGEFDLGSGFLTDWRPESPFDGLAVAFGADGSLLYVGGTGAFAVYR